MSKQKKETPKRPEAFSVELLEAAEGGPVLNEEPLHVINEIIMNVNAFVANKGEGVVAMLYLGSAQRYAMRFINPEGLLDPMQGTFCGVPVIWVDAPYHVNLVARRDAPEPG